MERIYQTLRELRKKNGKTQLELGDLLGISDSAYARMERGESDITLSKLKKIANFYNYTSAELLHYPDAIQIVGEKLKPEITISLKVVSQNHAETIKNVLKTIEGIKLNN
jgi:transcriptional regulator with XRE-family HTH domain